MEEDLGVYTFIDENGNVTQIRRKDRKKVIVYPEKPTLYEWTIIGVQGGIGEDDVIPPIAMGIIKDDVKIENDNCLLAKYSPTKKH